MTEVDRCPKLVGVGGVNLEPAYEDIIISLTEQRLSTEPGVTTSSRDGTTHQCWLHSRLPGPAAIVKTNLPVKKTMGL